MRYERCCVLPQSAGIQVDSRQQKGIKVHFFILLCYNVEDLRQWHFVTILLSFTEKRMIRVLKTRKVDGNSLLFACYFFMVWAIYIFVNRYEYGSSKMVLLLSILGSLAIVFPLAVFIIQLVRKIKLDRKERCYRRTVWIGLAVAFFGCNLLPLLIWFAAYFPGVFSPDSISQYNQAILGQYNDWHPFLHTFVFFTIPLKLTGQAASIVLFQVVYFAVLLSCFSISICRYFGVRAALTANLYIILNPYTGSIAMYPWKDVGFAMMALLIATGVFHIYFSESRWLAKPGNLILFGTALVLCTIFRHNAILYTLPVLTAVCLYSGRVLGIRLALLVLALMIVIKGPVYSAFGVEKPADRHTETMGMPLTIMANVAKEGTDKLSRPTVDFLFGIATKEQYKENYWLGNFNNLKWSGINTDIIEQTEVMDILAMTGECILKYPAVSGKAFFALTDMVYGLDGAIDGEPSLRITENSYGIVYKGNRMLANLLENYRWAFRSSPLRYFRYIGSTVFFMLAVLLGRCSLSRKSDWKKILLCIPILIYDFGTMLLLTGDDSRFFFASFLVCPAVILIALDAKREDEVAYE